MRHEARSRGAAWVWFVCAALAVAGLYPALGDHPAAQAACYLALSVGCVASVALGIRRNRPERSLVWHLLGSGATLYALANMIWYGYPVILHGNLPFPSLADALFIPAYLCFIGGLVLLTRARTMRSERAGALIDSAIVTVGAAVVAWVCVLGPTASDSEAPAFGRLVAMSYPLFDLCLIALAARLLFTCRSRPPAFWLLTTFVVSQLVADAVYAMSELQGTFHYGHPMTIGWLVSYGCLGAAALHPSMRTLAAPIREARPVRLSPLRLSFLAAAVLVAPVIYFVGGDGPDDPMLVGAMAVMFGLAIARMGLLVRQLESQTTRLGKRERELRLTVEQLHESKHDLAHQARHDALTGLPNRVLFGEKLEHAVTGHRPVAVMMLDLDGFKRINDSLGHQVGDALLVAIAGRLVGSLRPGDVVARFGGDEFIILLEDACVDEALRIARRVLAVFDEPVALGDRQVVAHGSVGVTICSSNYAANELLRNADAAMYEAKRKGGQRFEVFSEDMHARVLDRLALECDLRAARTGEELILHYQPVVDLRDGRLTGFEALLRWRHADRGMVSPADFIPIAEETGLIVTVGRWVLEEACQQLRHWNDRFDNGIALTMNVNVSARQLADPVFVGDVARVLRDTGIDPATLTLEITETMIVADEDEVCERLRLLKELGVRISVDDFGTGYSSLGHLRRFPIDELKIDRSFVAELGSDDNGGVATAAIRLARSLGLDIVAEGIEREDQIVELRRASCPRGQGFYFWKALDPGSVDALLRQTSSYSVLPDSPASVVLVVDDDDTVRRTTSRVLGKAGFEVVEAATGRAALHLAGEGQFDVAVVDVDLPDIQGFEVCRALKEMSRGVLPVLHVSGEAVALEDRVRGLESGADAYLTKPVAPSELIASLHSILRAAQRSNLTLTA